MKKYFHLSKISSYILSILFLLIFSSLFALFIVNTFVISFWFVFLVLFFLFCLVINYQILKRVILIGIKIDNGNVYLQGLGENETNKFHMNDIEKIELQDFKRNTIGEQELYKKVCICFFLKSGRTKRLELRELKNTKYTQIKDYFENR